MSDADLLDLLEILEAVINDRPEETILTMISSFRTAVRQRMCEKQGKV